MTSFDSISTKNLRTEENTTRKFFHAQEFLEKIGYSNSVNLRFYPYLDLPLSYIQRSVKIRGKVSVYISPEIVIDFSRSKSRRKNLVLLGEAIEWALPKCNIDLLEKMKKLMREDYSRVEKKYPTLEYSTEEFDGHKIRVIHHAGKKWFVAHDAWVSWGFDVSRIHQVLKSRIPANMRMKCTIRNSSGKPIVVTLLNETGIILSALSLHGEITKTCDSILNNKKITAKNSRALKKATLINIADSLGNTDRLSEMISNYRIY